VSRETKQGSNNLSVEQIAEAALALHGLSLSMGGRDGILLSFSALADAAAQVIEFDLADEIEPAPIFKA